MKENFIVHQTPKVDWLVDLEEQKNYRLSDLESSLFEMLDGSRTSEDIIKLISKNNLLNIEIHSRLEKIYEKNCPVQGKEMFYQR